MISKKIPLYLLFVLIVSVGAILPLFSHYFFPMHDDTQVARVFEMKTALVDGMFPVRWSSELGFGFGYPLFTFYAPLAYYIGGAIALIGFNALLATKIMIGIIMLIAGISMYFFAREYFNKPSAVASSILYVFAPYHALDLYVRGDISELLAYGLLPFLFFCFSRLALFQKNFVYIAGISYALLIISHNLTAFELTPFLAIFCFLLLLQSKKKLKLFKQFCYALILGLVLSAFYFLPAVVESSYTNVLSDVSNGSNFVNHFVCINQLWYSPWGFGGSAPGCIDGLSFSLGKLYIFLSVLSLFLIVYAYMLKKKVKLYPYLFFLSGFLLSIFLLLQISQPVWELIKPMAFIQFPWRFLIFASFFMSLLAGFALDVVPHIWNRKSIKWQIGGLGVLVIVVSITQIKLFQPHYYKQLSVSEYTSFKEVAYTASLLSDEYMPKNFTIPKSYSVVPKQAVTSLSKGITIVSIQKKTQKITALVNAESEGNVVFNIAYFPGWHMQVNGKDVTYTHLDNGLSVFVPKGFHEITAEYRNTLIENISDIISLLGILYIISAIILKKRSYGK